MFFDLCGSTNLGAVNVGLGWYEHLITPLHNSPASIINMQAPETYVENKIFTVFSSKIPRLLQRIMFGASSYDTNTHTSSIIWYQRKLGSKQAYHVVHQPVSRCLAVFADAWLSDWLAEISADLRETVAH